MPLSFAKCVIIRLYVQCDVPRIVFLKDDVYTKALDTKALSGSNSKLENCDSLLHMRLPLHLIDRNCQVFSSPELPGLFNGTSVLDTRMILKSSKFGFVW